MRIPTSPDSCLPREFPTGRLPDFVIRSCGLQLGWSRTPILGADNLILNKYDEYVITQHVPRVFLLFSFSFPPDV